MSFVTKLPEELYRGDAFDGFAAVRDFDLGTARGLAWMCQLAYETDDMAKIERILARWRMRLIAPLGAEVRKAIPVADTQGFVAAGQTCCIVAFAGTDPLKLANWMTNLDLKQDKTGAARGFKTAADSILPHVTKALADPAVAGLKIYLTGHSLGAALAVLVGAGLSAPAVADITSIYAIGMPRPANGEYADFYGPLLGARTYRLVHGEDLFPSVPPTAWGFRHVGRYLPCQRQGKFSAADLAADWRSDRPDFRAELMEELRRLRRRPWLIATAAVKRVALALALAVGRGPAGMRTDIGGIIIELLPPRLRDHMPDRYIGGLTPGASLF